MVLIYQAMQTTFITVMLVSRTVASIQSGSTGHPTSPETATTTPFVAQTQPMTASNNWLNTWPSKGSSTAKTPTEEIADQAVTSSTPPSSSPSPSVAMATSQVPVSSSIENGTSSAESTFNGLNISDFDTDSDGNHPSESDSPTKEHLSPHNISQKNWTSPNEKHEEDSLTNGKIRHMDVRKFLSVDKLIIVIAIVSGGLFLFIICLIVCLRRRRAASPSVKSSDLDDTASVAPSRKMSQDVYSIDEEDKDSFMGIPTNHQIWKELQVMSADSPVVAEAKLAEEKPPL